VGHGVGQLVPGVQPLPLVLAVKVQRGLGPIVSALNLFRPQEMRQFYLHNF
jgi:hypothetical protein